jgi:hypothetical protein
MSTAPRRLGLFEYFLRASHAQPLVFSNEHKNNANKVTITTALQFTYVKFPNTFHPGGDLNQRSSVAMAESMTTTYTT